MEHAESNTNPLAHFEGNPAFRRSISSWSPEERGLFARLAESVHEAGLDWWYVELPNEVARFGRKNRFRDQANKVYGVVYSGDSCSMSFRHGFAEQDEGKRQHLTQKLFAAIESGLFDLPESDRLKRPGYWPDELGFAQGARGEDSDSASGLSGVREGLQEILNTYTEARQHGAFSGHPVGLTIRRLEAAIKRQPAVAARAGLLVKASVGKGNWARVPWVALLNPRETTTTQRGVYGVFLFREDMSGVYLTFNQGVTEPIERLGRVRAHDELRSKASEIRKKSPGLSPSGFVLDERIDLRASGHLGRDYEVSTIAYKFYASGTIPNDAEIDKDLEALLAAYDSYVDGSKSGPPASVRTWVFQANPELYRLADAARSLPSITFEVRQHSSEVRTGDRVFLWQSGPDGGVIGLATVTSDPQVRPFPAAELPFAANRDRFREDFQRVDLRVESSLPLPLARRDLLSVPGLRDASILRGPQGTNFRLSPEEAATLLDIYEAALNKRPSVTPKLDLAAVVDSFSEALAESALRFPVATIRTFVSSLATKRFVILTGLSGSGKTQLALRFGQWCGPERVRVIPVRPDWTGPEYLLGYEDALLPAEGGQRAWFVPEALRFMLDAAADPRFPYVLVLDEMNLAHVERYFADVLSGIESDEPCLPHLNSQDGYWRLVDDESPRIRLPDNLFVIGTVNVDETTFMFSPKVLDRANTIEFRVHHTDLTSAPRRPKPLAAGPEALVRGFLEIARDSDYQLNHPAPGLDEYVEALKGLHEILSEKGFEFGHRTFYEAGRFASLLSAAGTDDWRTALDLQLLQKMLPRIHGSRRRLEALLKRLEDFCSSVDGKQRDGEPPHLPQSLSRVQRLSRSLIANQFAGFIE